MSDSHAAVSSPDRRWSRQPGLLLALAVLLLHAWWLRGLAEDAFISFRFARHLALGAGLTWNPGAPPVEGYTNFLWVILEAACLKLGLNLVDAIPLIGLALAATTVVLVHRTLVGRLECDERTATLSVCLLALAGPIAAWAVSGMETPLFTCLVWLAFDASLGGGTLMPAAAWLVLASLTRPEGALVAALLLGGGLVLRLLTGKGPTVRRHVSAAVAYLVAFGAYVAWRWHYFGWPFPNTFYAKTGGGLEQWLRGTLLTGHFVFEFLLPLVPWIFVACWAAAAPGLHTILVALERQHRRRAAGLAAVVAGVYTLYVMAVGGDYMAMHRFFVVLLPFWYLVLAFLVDPLVRRSRESRGTRAALWALVAWSCVATAVHSTPVDTLFFVRPSQQHGNYQGVQLERWHVSRLSTIGRFFERYRRTPRESLGTAAIGAIGYYADMPIVDFHGLVDVHIAHEPVPRRFGSGRPGHERHDYPYILDLRPTYLMFSRDLTPAPVDLEHYLPREMPDAVRERIDREYEPVSVWLDDPGNQEAGYFTFYRRRAEEPMVNPVPPVGSRPMVEKVGLDRAAERKAAADTPPTGERPAPHPPTTELSGTIVLGGAALAAAAQAHAVPDRVYNLLRGLNREPRTESSCRLQRRPDTMKMSGRGNRSWRGGCSAKRRRTWRPRHENLAAVRHDDGRPGGSRCGTSSSPTSPSCWSIRAMCGRCRGARRM